MKQLRLLLPAILSLYFIKATQAGSNFVDSVIWHNSNTLKGAAIVNNTSQIGKLLNEMDTDERAASQVLDALGQAQWYGNSAAEAILRGWLTMAERNGVSIPKRNEKIAPRSVLGETCLCQYLEDGYDTSSYMRGTDGGQVTSVDDQLAARVRRNDYQGLRVLLSKLRISPSNADAVIRATKAAKGQGHSESVVELETWLRGAQYTGSTTIHKRGSTSFYGASLNTGQSLRGSQSRPQGVGQRALESNSGRRRAISDPTGSGVGFGGQPYDSSAPFNDSSQGAFTGPSSSGTFPMNTTTSKASLSAPPGSEPEKTVSLDTFPSEHPTGHVEESSSGEQVVDADAQHPLPSESVTVQPSQFKEEPQAYQSQLNPTDAQSSKIISKQPVKPLKSILKRTTPISARLTPALEEVLQGMVRCHYCGQPMSQRLAANNIPNVKIISVRQIDPLGQPIIHRHVKVATKDSSVQGRLQPTIPLGKQSNTLGNAEPRLQSSQSLSLDTRSATPPVENRQRQAPTGFYPRSSSASISLLSSASTRPVIGPEYIRENSFEVPYLPPLPEYGPRPKRSRRDVSVQSVREAIKSQDSSGPTVSTPSSSLVIVPPPGDPVKAEGMPTGLVSVSQVPTSPQDQTTTAVNSRALGLLTSPQSPTCSKSLDHPSTTSSSQNDAPSAPSKAASHPQSPSPEGAGVQREPFTLKGDTYIPRENSEDSPPVSSSKGYTISSPVSTNPVLIVTSPANATVPGRSPSKKAGSNLVALQKLLCEPRRKNELVAMVEQSSYEDIRQLSLFTKCGDDDLCKTLPVIIPKLSLDDCDEMLKVHKKNAKVTECINLTMSVTIDEFSALLVELLDNNRGVVETVLAKYISDDEETIEV